MKWVQLPCDGEAAPGARSSHAIAVVGHTAYLFGGERQPRVPEPAQLFAFSLSDKTWSKVETAGQCPGPRVAATMASIGQHVYLFGGRTGVDMGEGAQQDLSVLDTTADPPSWSPVQLAPGSPAPPPRSFHAMTATGGRLYVFGGCGQAGRLADLWAFDPATRAWEELPASETVAARGGSVLVASRDGKQLLVLGGFNGAEMADCHAFDLEGKAWSCPTCCDAAEGAAGALTSPLARSVFAAAVHMGGDAGGCCSHASHVLAFAGEVSPSDKGHAGAGNFTADLWCLDSQAGGGWHRLAVPGAGPGPRGWFAACATGDGMLVSGGLGADNERLADLWLLSLH